MCGIFGFNWEDKTLLAKMAKVLSHRGPDNTGKIIDEHVSLGHNRLSIIDTSSRGNQPIFNKKGDICVIYNGEIYNFVELRERLESKGYKFSTKTDTEVIVHAYEEWGEECPKFFEGIFSFCIYDFNKKRLFLARDPLGVKPLFYWLSDDKFIFSSEIKGILEANIKTGVNLSGLRKYLRFKYIPDDETLFDGIKKVPAAHCVIFDLKTKKFNLRKYWFIDAPQTADSEEVSAIKLDNLLRKTVSNQLVSDVPVGVYLSGGVDSSLITGMVRNLDKNSILKTFSVGFAEATKNKDLYFAKKVADSVESDHKEFYFSSEDVLKDLNKIIWQNDEPIGEAGIIPNYFLSKHVSNKVKVVLAGEGGDEVFGGYEYYNFYNKISKMNKITPLFLKRIMKPLLPEGFSELISENDNFDMLNNNSVMKVFGKNEIQKLTNGSVSKVEIISKGDKINNDGNNLLYTDVKTLLSECFNTKFDRATMANSIEGRVPLQSPSVVKFAFSLPFSYKMDKGSGKKILKQVAIKYIPKEVIERKKQGFGTPISEWVNKDFKSEIHDSLQNSSLVNRKILNKGEIDFILNKGNSLKVWTLFSLEKWSEKYERYF